MDVSGNPTLETGEVAQCLRGLDALPEDPKLVSRTLSMAYNLLELQLQGI